MRLCRIFMTQNLRGPDKRKMNGMEGPGFTDPGTLSLNLGLMKKVGNPILA